MSDSKEESSVQPDMSGNKILLKLTSLFAEPSWLNVSKLRERRRKLWIALVALLVAYLFDWGLSTERAVYCLLNKQIPS